MELYPSGSETRRLNTNKIISLIVLIQNGSGNLSVILIVLLIPRIFCMILVIKVTLYTLLGSKH